MKITSSRTHATTDNLLEYRLEIDPRLLVRAAENGIEGRRSAPTTGWSDEDDEDGEEKTTGKVDDPSAPRRYWLPACMVEKGEPDLAQAFEEAKRAKEAKKAARGTGRGRGKFKGTTRAGTAQSKSRAGTTAYDSGSEGEFPASHLSTPNVTPRKPKTVGAGQENGVAFPLAPKGTVNGFFAASKTTIPSELRSQKSSHSNMPSSSKVSDATSGKGKTKATRDTSTTRVAALFEGQEIKIFKDLTKPKQKTSSKDDVLPKSLRSKDSGFSSAASDAPSRDTGARNMPFERSVPQMSYPPSSPMRSTTNLPSYGSPPSASDPPEAGPSKPSTYISSAARTSAWKPAPFPMADFEIPPRYDSPPPSDVAPDQDSPSRRRARRMSSPRPSGAAPSAERLQKSPRKSKKQASPRSRSISPAQGSDEDETLGPIAPLQLLPTKKAAVRPPRRAVMKDKVKPSTRPIIEISSDSDVPPPKQKIPQPMFTVKKPIATALGEKRGRVPPPPPDEVIDLCSD